MSVILHLQMLDFRYGRMRGCSISGFAMSAIYLSYPDYFDNFVAYKLAGQALQYCVRPFSS